MRNCFIIPVLSISLLNACINRDQIAELEDVQGDYYNQPSIASLLNKGLAVGNAYLDASDRVASGMDGAAVFNILLAAGAASSIINGASDESVLRAGVAGVAGNQVIGYFEPSAARDALTRAANRQFCIVSHGAIYADISDLRLQLILANGFNSVRIALRSDLNRDLESYSSLFEQYKTSVEAPPEKVEVPRIAGGRMSVDLQEVRQKILECVGIT